MAYRFYSAYNINNDANNQSHGTEARKDFEVSNWEASEDTEISDWQGCPLRNMRERHDYQFSQRREDRRFFPRDTQKERRALRGARRELSGPSQRQLKRGEHGGHWPPQRLYTPRYNEIVTGRVQHEIDSPVNEQPKAVHLSREYDHSHAVTSMDTRRGTAKIAERDRGRRYDSYAQKDRQLHRPHRYASFNRTNRETRKIGVDRKLNDTVRGSPLTSKAYARGRSDSKGARAIRGDKNVFLEQCDSHSSAAKDKPRKRSWRHERSADHTESMDSVSVTVNGVSDTGNRTTLETRACDDSGESNRYNSLSVSRICSSSSSSSDSSECSSSSCSSCSNCNSDERGAVSEKEKIGPELKNVTAFADKTVTVEATSSLHTKTIATTVNPSSGGHGQQSAFVEVVPIARDCNMDAERPADTTGASFDNSVAYSPTWRRSEADGAENAAHADLKAVPIARDCNAKAEGLMETIGACKVPCQNSTTEDSVTRSADIETCQKLMEVDVAVENIPSLTDHTQSLANVHAGNSINDFRAEVSALVENARYSTAVTLLEQTTEDVFSGHNQTVETTSSLHIETIPSTAKVGSGGCGRQLAFVDSHVAYSPTGHRSEGDDVGTAASVNLKFVPIARDCNADAEGPAEPIGACKIHSQNSTTEEHAFAEKDNVTHNTELEACHDLMEVDVAVENIPLLTDHTQSLGDVRTGVSTHDFSTAESAHVDNARYSTALSLLKQMTEDVFTGHNETSLPIYEPISPGDTQADSSQSVLRSQTAAANTTLATFTGANLQSTVEKSASATNFMCQCSDESPPEDTENANRLKDSALETQNISFGASRLNNTVDFGQKCSLNGSYVGTFPHGGKVLHQCDQSQSGLDCLAAACEVINAELAKQKEEADIERSAQQEDTPTELQTVVPQPQESSEQWQLQDLDFYNLLSHQSNLRSQQPNQHCNNLNNNVCGKVELNHTLYAVVTSLILCASCKKAFNRTVICDDYSIQLNRPIQCVCGCVMCTVCYQDQRGCKRHNVLSSRGTVNTTAHTLASCNEMEHVGEWNLRTNVYDHSKSGGDIDSFVQEILMRDQACDELFKSAFAHLLRMQDSISFKYWSNESMPDVVAYRYVCIPHSPGFWDHILVGLHAPPNMDKMIGPDDYLPKLFNVVLGHCRFHWCCFVFEKEIILAMWCTLLRDTGELEVLTLLDHRLRNLTMSLEFRTMVFYLFRWFTAQYVSVPHERSVKIVLYSKPFDSLGLVDLVTLVASKCGMKKETPVFPYIQDRDANIYNPNNVARALFTNPFMNMTMLNRINISHEFNSYHRVSSGVTHVDTFYESYI